MQRVRVKFRTDKNMRLEKSCDQCRENSTKYPVMQYASHKLTAREIKPTNSCCKNRKLRTLTASNCLLISSNSNDS